MGATPKTIIKMKAWRKAIAMRYKMSKSWTEVDAALALKAEETNARNLQKDIILIIRFPDPEISREIVKCYSPDIKSVHFQLNFAPRYCLVHLKPGASVEKTIETLSKIPFGTGFLSVEIKQISRKAHTTKWNEIDPYTLYVGNLPTTIACSTLKYHFPGAARIDIGFAQRMKYTRYAFIRYRTVQQAIEAYKRMLDAEIGGRTLTIHFRRLTSSSDCNKDGEVESNEEAQDDVLSQPSIAAEDNSMSSSLIIEPSETFDQKSSIEDSAIIQEEQTNIISNETTHGNDDDHDLDQNNGTHSHDRVAEETSVTDVVNSESTTADNPTRTLPNIKPDPDVDSYDIVMRNDEITTRFVMNEHNIKQENELSTEFEFFAPISTQDNTNSANRNKSLIQDAVSVQSITGETGNSSTMSASSLGEFLQTCQRPRVESIDIDDIIGPPQRKQGRQDNAALNSTVKTEPIEKKDTRVKDNSTVLSNNAIKREATTNQENTSVININSMDSRNEAVYKQDENLRPRKTNTHNLTTESTLSNNDDLVPSNALFLRYGNRSCLEYGNDVCDTNEFFETITKNSVERPSQVMKGIKTEPICRRVNKRSNEIITNCYESKSSENSRVIDSISNRSQLQTKNNSATLAGVDDDMVPEQNMLSSRLTSHTDSLNNSHQQYFKEETENNDLFSTPLINSRNDATNNQSEDSDLGDLWNLSSDLNHKIQKTKEVSKNCTPIGSNEDDDIILVSDTISRHPKNAGSKFTPMKTNTFTCNQVDLLSFKHKITMAEASWEISKVLPHHHH